MTRLNRVLPWTLGVLIGSTMMCYPTTSQAEESNRNEVRANLEKDGWRAIWGKNFTEGDWARGTAAIAESVAAENPGPFLAWFEQTLDENFAKIERNLKDVARRDLERWTVQSLKAKRIVTYRGFEIEAGFATYNRWQRTVVEVPDGVQLQGVKSKVKMKKIENKTPLPNWHQFYIRYKLVENRTGSQAGGNTGDKIVKVDYTIKNDSGRSVQFQMQPSGKSYALEAGRTFRGTSHEVNGKPPTITLEDSGRTFRLTAGNHKFWWISKERRVGFDRSTD